MPDIEDGRSLEVLSEIGGEVAPSSKMAARKNAENFVEKSRLDVKSSLSCDIL